MAETIVRLTERLGSLETGLANHAEETKTRMDQINDRVSGVENWMASVKDDTAVILSVVGGATRAGRMIKVHGPRVLAAVFGWAVATGKIDQELFAALKSIFLF